MTKKAKTVLGIVISVLILLILVTMFFELTPLGKSIKNTWMHSVQKADDDTNYATLKKVEDTCRAMIASYNSDRLVYEQYKDSDDPAKQEWAEQAKMRANKTASSYNNYILNNSYIWRNNVPNDIYTDLKYID